jgi:hypothetical protein
MPNPYFGKAVDVDRVLLVKYPERLNLRELAKESSVSLGEAHNVSRALINERLALRESDRSELKLMDPKGLLERLAKVNNLLSNAKFLEYYTPEEDISKFLDRLKPISYPDYAITGLAGAMLVAPFVRPTNIHVYVKKDEDAEALADRLGLMPVEANGNVKFAIPGSTGVFYGARVVNGVKVVSDIQLYMDLLNYPARGEEAAGEVYKKIEENWKQGSMHSGR